MGKRLRLLCSDPDPVDGEISGFGTASLHELSLGSLKRKLTFNEVAGLMVSVSASHVVGSGFAPRPS